MASMRRCEWSCSSSFEASGRRSRHRERDKAVVFVIGAIESAGAKAEDESSDAGLGIDVGMPAPGIVGKANAGGLREK